VDFPIENGGSFHSKLLVYQRVSGIQNPTVWELPKAAGISVEYCRALSAGMGKVHCQAAKSKEFQKDTLNQENVHDMQPRGFEDPPIIFAMSIRIP
jgi:hypothetical protein